MLRHVAFSLRNGLLKVPHQPRPGAGQPFETIACILKVTEGKGIGRIRFPPDSETALAAGPGWTIPRPAIALGLTSFRPMTTSVRITAHPW